MEELELHESYDHTTQHSENLRGVVSEEVTNGKQLIVEIEKHFVKRNKVEISMLLYSLTFMRFKDNGNIRVYIMEKSHIVSKLKNLKIGLLEDVLIHLVLNSLSA